MSCNEVFMSLEMLFQPAEKVCVACKMVKSKDNFRTRRASKDGLTPRCKACLAESRVREANRLVLLRDGKKTCTICLQPVALEHFTRSKTGQLGYGSYCRDCARARAKTYYVKRLELQERIEQARREARKAAEAGEVLVPAENPRISYEECQLHAKSVEEDNRAKLLWMIEMREKHTNTLPTDASLENSVGSDNSIQDTN